GRRGRGGGRRGRRGLRVLRGAAGHHGERGRERGEWHRPNLGNTTHGLSLYSRAHGSCREAGSWEGGRCGRGRKIPRKDGSVTAGTRRDAFKHLSREKVREIVPETAESRIDGNFV